MTGVRGRPQRPDFFILGAPKCGTSTLFELLRRHPGVYLPDSKIEPHYFARDIALHRRHPNMESYLSLFADAPADALVGEASTWYLYSKVALQGILECNPQAKCLVVLRNPVDMAHSMHAFNLLKFQEDVHEFQKAWSLQTDRRTGRCLPPNLVDRAFVQYFDACALADAVARAQTMLPADQIQIHVFEDFVADPAGAMTKVWDFLGLQSIPHSNLPRENAHRRWRQPRLARLLNQRSRIIESLYAPAKHVANRLGFRPGRLLHRMNESYEARLPMPQEFRISLLGAFAENNDRLRQLLDHPLDSWRN